MKKLKKMYEKNEQNKVVEQKTEKGERIFKSKRAMLTGEIFRDDDEIFQEIVSAVVDELGGITIKTLEIEG